MNIAAHAKINLCLDVVGKREDGYHIVSMILQSIALRDEITVERTAGEIRLVVEPGAGLAENALETVRPDQSNLMYRAARLMQEQFGLSGGFDICLRKNIPVAAGLAGGSTDAAAVLRAVNQLCGLGLDSKQLERLGLKLGADVPFCISGGTQLAEGIGECLTPLESRLHSHLLIVKPAVPVSTPEIYAGYDRMEQQIVHGSSARCRTAVETGDREALAEAMFNVLEPVTAARHPVIRRMRQFMLEHGAAGAMMSGSGPSVFGLFDSRAAAEACRDSMRRELMRRELIRGNKADNETEADGRIGEMILTEF